MVADDVARPLSAVVSGLVGLVIGSFLNVVIYRAPRGLSLAHPRSHCPSCNTQLSAIDNVPLLSWLLLRGRCRYCHQHISLRYPIVELVTALFFTGLALALPSLAPLVSLCVLAGAVIAAAAIDADGLPVPWAVAVTALVGAASLALVTLSEGASGRLGWALIGASATALAEWVALPNGEILRRRMVMPLVVVTSLGFGAGWLWFPAGFGVAGGCGITALTIRAWERRRDEPRPPVSRFSAIPYGVGLALILASAAVGGA